jgi:DNA-binding GntR family transcriptional regulator
LFQLRGITIEQLTEARIWISEIVTRVACERATPQDLDLLEQNVAAAEEAYERGDMREKLAIQIEFHNLLARATHNPVLILLTETLVEMMRTFAEAFGPEHNDIAIAARRRLLPKLQAHDAAGAIAEMTNHLETLRDRYVKLVREQEASYSSRPGLMPRARAI